MTQPTRTELVARVRADYRDELGIDPISRSWETAAASAQAGLAKGLYGQIDWALRQLSPDTADDVYFWRHADLLGVPPKAAQAWRGTGTVTGTAGTLVTALAQLARSDGQLYQIDATVAIAGTTTVAITAMTAGAAGACVFGQPLTFSSPVAGVAPTLTVTATTQTGDDAEIRDDAQPRVLDRLSDPPRGGSLADYRRWALEVPGVTRAYARKVGVNTIWIAALRDNDGDGAAIIPDAGELVEIENHIDLVRPAQVDVVALALTANVVNITIADLVPDLPSVRAAIVAELKDFFGREGEPDSSIALSRISGAISEAEGEVSHTLVSPASPVVSTFAQVPILGSVNFV